MSMLHCHRENPLRVLDWRWQRAESAYRRTGLAPGRRRDGADGYGWIRKAMRFIAAEEAANDDRAKSELACEMPDIFWAHYIHTLKDEWPRHKLQAMLLTRDDYWSIGYHLGMTPETVAAYEALFFCVREKIDHVDYIANMVFKDQLQFALTPRDYGVVWKLYGYCYGSHTLRAVISSTVNPAVAMNADTVGSCLQDDAIATMKLKASLAAKMTPVNGDTALLLLEQFAKFVEIERMTDSEGRSQSQLMENIAATFMGLPFGVDSKSPLLGAPVQRGPLAEFDSTEMELTFEETMRLATGDKLPYLQKTKTLKLNHTHAEVRP